MRFCAIPAILLRAPAHVLPGVLAIFGRQGEALFDDLIGATEQ
jgi:hypothetical protein